MWQLKEISARNICAFRELKYAPLQGHTTLVFGNNLDNDSQGSNGSGKSALIEAFAIALTGESLRKVNAEEIINDACEEALVACVLSNTVTGDELEIERTFSRNASQTIQLRLNGEETVQSSILEYNRYILNAIGLSKSDVLSSYILSKHTYTSFLNASDRVKKELINRFSNGSLVDESVEHLKADMEQVKELVLDAEKRVANSEGRVSTITEQIDAAHAEESEQARRKDELIEAHEEAIARLRGRVREANQCIKDCEDRLDLLDELDHKFEDLENSSTSISECHAQLIQLIKQNSFARRTMKDYPAYSKELGDRLEKCNKNIQSASKSILANEEEAARVCKSYDELLEQYETIKAGNSPKRKKLQAHIEATNETISSLIAENRQIAEESADLQKEIARLQGLLAGTIECPACHHRFVLQSEYSVDQLNRQLEKMKKSLSKNNRAESSNDGKINEARDIVDGCRKEINDIDKRINELSESVSNADALANSLKAALNTYQTSLSIARNQATRIQEQIASLRKNLFDDVFDMLDVEIRQTEADIEKHKIVISTSQGNINSYEEAIKNLQNATVDDTIEKLEAKKAEYEKELNVHAADLESVNSQLAELVKQEARFVDFKTHLANSKIEALGQLTNEFLEAIGSDIRIAFSGYTILKSGKVRDKITISLLRDGIDCGSFAKFSAGEQCRVNLASILALHKLTNVNCGDGKGLDLLILDEILDATDEAGLANMFDALNALQITSMVVSHGQIAEAYPYRLTVTKQNGISIINETNA